MELGKHNYLLCLLLLNDNMCGFQVTDISDHISRYEAIAVDTIKSSRFIIYSILAGNMANKAMSIINIAVIYHSICLKCGSWSGVMTLKVVPSNGNETGTETTVPLSVVAATKRVVVRWFWLPCFTDINLVLFWFSFWQFLNLKVVAVCIAICVFWIVDGFPAYFINGLCFVIFVYCLRSGRTKCSICIRNPFFVALALRLSYLYVCYSDFYVRFIYVFYPLHYMISMSTWYACYFESGKFALFLVCSICYWVHYLNDLLGNEK